MAERKPIPSGSVFGLWTVIEAAPKKGLLSAYLCRCKCQRIVSVFAASLRNGSSTRCMSCGSSKTRKAPAIGDRFHRLTITSEQYKEGRHWYVDTVCDCGEKYKGKIYAIRKGNTKSCGCYLTESRYKVKARLSHGMRRTRAYSKWRSMLDRCTNPNYPGFENYGGRGIRVCDRWMKFESFYEDMGEPPPGLSLDRIDVNGNYEPGNCRWADWFQQARNRRSNKPYEFEGKTLLAVEWAELKGLPYDRFRQRLSLGWSMERALNQPFRKSPVRR